ncbi:hypothetical protein BHE74_00057061 [Ensete ventricosum]|nr:hypothetical protein BHE74_00057061 [Ensete ventricosum]
MGGTYRYANHPLPDDLWLLTLFFLTSDKKLQMAEYFNRKALLSGSIPLGSFNCAFSFSGSKKIDAAATKSLAMNGKFIPLCKVQLMKHPLSLQDHVKAAVPRSWEPLSLAR